MKKYIRKLGFNRSHERNDKIWYNKASKCRTGCAVIGTRYSGNAFEMDAGENRQVTVSLPEKLHIGAPLRVSALNAALQLISWR